MDKYIDAEWLKQNFNTVFWSQITKTIDSAPSIDIVFCKECKHRYNDGWIEPRWTCDYLKDMRLKDDDFCSYGERKESE